MSIKWARVLPVVSVVLNLTLLRLLGNPELSDQRLLSLFIGLNAPVVLFRFLPPIFYSPTGMFLGCVDWGLNVVAGAPVLWYAVGRYLDGDLRWPRGKFLAIAVGLLLVGVGGFLAVLGVGASEYWNRTEVAQDGPRVWMPLWVCVLFLVWAAVFLYAAWRQILAGGMPVLSSLVADRPGSRTT